MSTCQFELLRALESGRLSVVLNLVKNPYNVAVGPIYGGVCFDLR